MQRFKVVITGDGGVGKSSLIHRHLTGDFKQMYIPTLGADVHPLVFQTNYGPIVFDIWDTSGQEKFAGLREAYATGAHAVIGMCDLSSRHTAESLEKWHTLMVRQTPTICCGNKSDVVPCDVTTDDKNRLIERWGVYYDISVKTNYNCEQPFLHLARILTKHLDLVFIEPSTSTL